MKDNPILAVGAAISFVFLFVIISIGCVGVYYDHKMLQEQDTISECDNCIIDIRRSRNEEYPNCSLDSRAGHRSLNNGQITHSDSTELESLSPSVATSEISPLQLCPPPPYHQIIDNWSNHETSDCTLNR